MTRTHIDTLAVRRHEVGAVDPIAPRRVMVTTLPDAQRPHNNWDNIFHIPERQRAYALGADETQQSFQLAGLTRQMVAYNRWIFGLVERREPGETLSSDVRLRHFVLARLDLRSGVVDRVVPFPLRRDPELPWQATLCITTRGEIEPLHDDERAGDVLRMHINVGHDNGIADRTVPRVYFNTNFQGRIGDEVHILEHPLSPIGRVLDFAGVLPPATASHPRNFG
jgi:hypothetical protein